MSIPPWQLPFEENYRTPTPIATPDWDLIVMFDNNMYVFSSSRATQTDPDVFYINGKPARAVPPFRVVPVKPKPQAAMEPHMEEPEAEEMWPQYGDDQLEQQGQMQQLETQQPDDLEPEDLEPEEQEPEPELEESDSQQAEMQESVMQLYEPHHPDMEDPELQVQWQEFQRRQSQENQTELQYLHRQLLLLADEGHSNACED